MKNKLLLGAILISTVGIFTACSDDNDSNPTLIQPTEFVLNTPAYVNETVDLEKTEALRLTWSQPKFTADNAPINATYEIQVSPTNSFTVSTNDADADEEGNLIADYAVIDKTSTTCFTNLAAGELDKALVKVAKWASDAVPAEQKAFIRVNAFVLEGTKRLNAVTSNVIEINVAPYYIELKDAAPIMWYLVGEDFAINGWNDKPGEDSYPLFLQSGYTYDKVTGAGEITYLNYITTGGWKIQPADFNWDYGFMGGGSANTAVYRDGGADAGNITCDPAGYYLVTINTADNTCTIVKKDITPTVYNQVCIIGSFNDWSDTNMIPVNKNGENHVWCHTLTVADNAIEQIKFRTPGSWDVNWGYGSFDGEISTCGKAAAGGKNIGVEAGTWIIMFNDITGEFSIIPKK
nr:SusF/SusE family outer membrane protein [uncultured Bacteroides sp.]